MVQFLTWFPAEPLLEPSLADPRAPASQVSTHLGQDHLDATLGLDVPIAQVEDVQVHLVAGGWMSFRQDGPLTYALLTFDGTFGVPVQVAWEGWRFEAGWRHVSAHLADGTRMNGPELRIPITWSREVLWTRAARPVGPVTPWVGASYLARTTPVVQRWGAEVGARAEWRVLFAEVEVGWEEGLGVGAFAGVHRRPVHFGLVAYRGPDRRGQYLGEEAAWIGLKLALTSPRS